MTETPGEYNLSDSESSNANESKFPKLWAKLKSLDDSPTCQLSEAFPSR